MLDFINRGCFLELRILEEESLHEAAMDVDVDILVDRRRDEEATMLAIVGRKIGENA